PFLLGEYASPDPERASSCERDTQFAHPSDQLDHQALRLAIKLEMLPLIPEADAAGERNHGPAQKSQHNCDQCEADAVVEHQCKAEQRKDACDQTLDRMACRNASDGLDAKCTVGHVARGECSKKRNRKP